ncbi:protein PRRC2A-like [Ursus americanus]|uniref:protein PRRC2A-like n=1 Tax=Ursus americanus TaxID=9643 RepID=UPI001E6791B6|nr:protein PRRC2A-like [Ursus americanus]
MGSRPPPCLRALSSPEPLAVRLGRPPTAAPRANRLPAPPPAWARLHLLPTSPGLRSRQKGMALLRTGHRPFAPGPGRPCSVRTGHEMANRPGPQAPWAPDSAPRLSGTARLAPSARPRGAPHHGHKGHQKIKDGAKERMPRTPPRQRGAGQEWPPIGIPATWAASPRAPREGSYGSSRARPPCPKRAQARPPSRHAWWARPARHTPHATRAAQRGTLALCGCPWHSQAPTAQPFHLQAPGTPTAYPGVRAGGWCAGRWALRGRRERRRRRRRGVEGKRPGREEPREPRAGRDPASAGVRSLGSRPPPCLRALSSPEPLAVRLGRPPTAAPRANRLPAPPPAWARLHLLPTSPGLRSRQKGMALLRTGHRPFAPGPGRPCSVRTGHEMANRPGPQAPWAPDSAPRLSGTARLAPSARPRGAPHHGHKGHQKIKDGAKERMPRTPPRQRGAGQEWPPIGIPATWAASPRAPREGSYGSSRARPPCPKRAQARPPSRHAWWARPARHTPHATRAAQRGTLALCGCPWHSQAPTAQPFHLQAPGTPTAYPGVRAGGWCAGRWALRGRRERRRRRRRGVEGKRPGREEPREPRAGRDPASAGVRSLGSRPPPCLRALSSPEPLAVRLGRPPTAAPRANRLPAPPPAWARLHLLPTSPGLRSRQKGMALLRTGHRPFAPGPGRPCSVRTGHEMANRPGPQAPWAPDSAPRLSGTARLAPSARPRGAPHHGHKGHQKIKDGAKERMPRTPPRQRGAGQEWPPIGIPATWAASPRAPREGSYGSSRARPPCPKRAQARPPSRHAWWARPARHTPHATRAAQRGTLALCGCPWHSQAPTAQPFHLQAPGTPTAYPGVRAGGWCAGRWALRGRRERRRRRRRGVEGKRPGREEPREPRAGRDPASAGVRSLGSRPPPCLRALSSPEPLAVRLGRPPTAAPRANRLPAPPPAWARLHLLPTSPGLRSRQKGMALLRTGHRPFAPGPGRPCSVRTGHEMANRPGPQAPWAPDSAPRLSGTARLAPSARPRGAPHHGHKGHQKIKDGAKERMPRTPPRQRGAGQEWPPIGIPATWAASPRAPREGSYGSSRARPPCPKRAQARPPSRHAWWARPARHTPHATRAAQRGTLALCGCPWHSQAPTAQPFHLQAPGTPTAYPGVRAGGWCAGRWALRGRRERRRRRRRGVEGKRPGREEPREPRAGRDPASAGVRSLGSRPPPCLRALSSPEPLAVRLGRPPTAAPRANRLPAPPPAWARLHLLPTSPGLRSRQKGMALLRTGHRPFAPGPGRPCSVRTGHEMANRPGPQAPWAPDSAPRLSGTARLAPSARPRGAPHHGHKGHQKIKDGAKERMPRTPPRQRGAGQEWPPIGIPATWAASPRAPREGSYGSSRARPPCPKRAQARPPSRHAWWARPARHTPHATRAAQRGTLALCGCPWHSQAPTAQPFHLQAPGTPTAYPGVRAGGWCAGRWALRGRRERRRRRRRGVEGKRPGREEPREPRAGRDPASAGVRSLGSRPPPCLRALSSPEPLAVRLGRPPTAAPRANRLPAPPPAWARLHLLPTSPGLRSRQKGMALLRTGHRPFAPGPGRPCSVRTGHEMANRPGPQAPWAPDSAPRLSGTARLAPSARPRGAPHHGHKGHQKIKDGAKERMPRTPPRQRGAGQEWPPIGIPATWAASPRAPREGSYGSSRARPPCPKRAQARPPSRHAWWARPARHTPHATRAAQRGTLALCGCPWHSQAPTAQPFHLQAPGTPTAYPGVRAGGWCAGRWALRGRRERRRRRRRGVEGKRPGREEPREPRAGRDPASAGVRSLGSRPPPCLRALSSPEPLAVRLGRPPTAAPRANRLPAPPPAWARLHLLPTSPGLRSRQKGMALLRTGHRPFAPGPGRPCSVRTGHEMANRPGPQAPWAPDSAPRLSGTARLAPSARPRGAPHHGHKGHQKIKDGAKERMPRTPPRQRGAGQEWPPIGIPATWAASPRAPREGSYGSSRARPPCPKRAQARPPSRHAWWARPARHTPHATRAAQRGTLALCGCPWHSQAPTAQPFHLQAPGTPTAYPGVRAGGWCAGRWALRGRRERRRRRRRGVEGKRPGREEPREPRAGRDPASAGVRSLGSRPPPCLRALSSPEPLAVRLGRPPTAAPRANRLPAPPPAWARLHLLPTSPGLRSRQKGMALLRTGHRPFAPGPGRPCSVRTGHEMANRPGPQAPWAPDSAPRLSGTARLAPSARPRGAPHHGHKGHQKIKDGAKERMPRTPPRQRGAGQEWPPIGIPATWAASPRAPREGSYGSSRARPPCPKRAQARPPSRPNLNPSLVSERSIPRGLAPKPHGFGTPEQYQRTQPATQKETVPLGTPKRIRSRRNLNANVRNSQEIPTLTSPLVTNPVPVTHPNSAKNSAPRKLISATSENNLPFDGFLFFGPLQLTTASSGSKRHCHGFLFCSRMQLTTASSGGKLQRSSSLSLQLSTASSGAELYCHVLQRVALHVLQWQQAAMTLLPGPHELLCLQLCRGKLHCHVVQHLSHCSYPLPPVAVSCTRKTHSVSNASCTLKLPTASSGGNLHGHVFQHLALQLNTTSSDDRMDWYFLQHLYHCSHSLPSVVVKGTGSSSSILHCTASSGGKQQWHFIHCLLHCTASSGGKLQWLI